MSTFPALDIVSLLLLLLLGRLLGLLLSEYKISSSVGELLSGIILAFFLGATGLSGQGIEALASVGAIMLMFLTGLYTDYGDFVENLSRSTAVAAGGVLATVSVVYGACYLLGLGPWTSLLVGVILSNTAVEVTAKVMMDDPPSHETRAIIMGAAFADDILALFLIAVVTSPGAGAGRLSWIALEVSLFLLLTLYLIPKILLHGGVLDRIRRSTERVELRLFTFSILLALALSLLAMELGLNMAVGAYTAGLAIASWGSKIEPLLRRRAAYLNLIEMTDPMLRAFFTPIFFGYVGIIAGQRIFQGIGAWELVLSLILFLAMFAGKFVGCYATAKALGVEESSTVGIAMEGRGMLEYVIIMVAFKSGVIDESTFFAMVTASAISMIVTPIAYRLVRRRGEGAA